VSVHAQGGGVRRDIEQIAKEIAGSKTIDLKRVDSFVARWRWDDVMAIYRPVVKGRPSVELILAKAAKKATYTPAETAELQKIAEISRVVAFLAPCYKPEHQRDTWGEHVKEIDKASCELLKAIRAGNATAVKRAAINLGGGCVDCHGDYR
jgi:hypothetical protein